MNKIKTTAENTFYQLIVVYTLLVILISFNLFWKYTLHFEFFALILGILGIALVWKIDDVEVFDKPRTLVRGTLRAQEICSQRQISVQQNLPILLASKKQVPIKPRLLRRGGTLLF